ncbi:hypothetical protein BCL57_000201 [Agromyces flavus]|uniref:DUF4337 domain-containing protein n=1 Tax=Agromyces flavus TaxID=589382 RepID=A0A1H1W1R3_9MICO|nr:hypothetical protein [Agromyces flavus]MCP2366059.1 hypothetical protein [Agromyces flavus]GGI43917.1 hypothetical protein GCM10010932_01990 [Agromyces flavus]SDS90660.1 hypothetical protein SAMN04489721_2131 [Agromyces flavus]
MTDEAADPDAAEQTRVSRWRHRPFIEIVAVAMLSVTAVLTAWCGFQASQWSGEQSIAFAEASAARVEAADADGEAREARVADLVIFAEWVTATARGETALADEIAARFTPHFRVAFDAWQADEEAAPSPFAMDEYVPPGTEESAERTAYADARAAEGVEFNERGDDYSLLTVLFALVLFLTAMAQRDIRHVAAWVLLGLAGVIAVIGFVAMLTFPALW